jgi:hypothetical protein
VRREQTIKHKIILGLALVLSGVFPGFCNMACYADEPSPIQATIPLSKDAMIQKALAATGFDMSIFQLILCF